MVFFMFFFMLIRRSIALEKHRSYIFRDLIKSEQFFFFYSFEMPRG